MNFRDSHSSRTAGIALIALSATAFGAMAIFARIAYADGADLYGVLPLRFALAALVLAPLARHRGVAWPPRRTLLGLAAMGGIGYVGQSFCYFSALSHADASLVALLLYLFPAIVTVLAVAFLGERLTRAKLAAVVLSVAGTALTVGGGRGEPLGIALGLAAALIYAVYITVGTRLTRGVDALAVSTVVCAAAACVYLGIAAARAALGMPPALPQHAQGWLAVLAIAAVSTVLAILCFFAGLARLGAMRASVLSTLEPVVTVALAAWWLGETVALPQWLGGLLILAAVIWLARARES